MKSTTDLVMTNQGFKVILNAKPPMDVSMLYDEQPSKMYEVLKALVVSVAAVQFGAGAFNAEALTTDAVFNHAQGSLHHVIMQIIDLVTTLAQPVLWGWMVIGFLLMIQNPSKGLQKVKSVVYAYLGITLIPAAFQLLSFVAKIVSHAFSSSVGGY